VENAYSQYLTNHSGYSNAYTAARETNYFFEVSYSAGSDSKAPDGTTNGTTNGHAESPLYGALDRFAQFFIAPLFLEETLDRELRAVDSENKKNLQSDNWRFSQLDKTLSNQKHPYHHFSTGNLVTLRDEPRQRGLNIRQEFMNFHDKHYSANRMKLVVLGKESLDQLEAWVVELFSGVKNKDLKRNTWPDSTPYGPDEVLTQVFAKPVMDTRSLDLSFTCQNEESLYESHPGRYLSHLIGHEGPGSILAYIKAKGWANDLSAGGSDVDPDTGMFHISIRLTTEGFKQYKKIVEVVFQYIGLIKQAGPQQWVMEELKSMAAVDFRFKQKSPASKFTSRLSSVMQNPFLPRDWLLSGNTLIRHFDQKTVQQALDCLKPDNWRLTLVSQEGNFDKKEKWYGTEYRMEKVDEELQETVRKAIKSSSSDVPESLHLPHKNEFIPTRLTVEKKEVAEPAKHPVLIRNKDGVRTWWKKDDRFWVPKGSVVLALRNPLLAVTAANYVKAALFSQLVKDELTEYAYDAEISGLEYSLDTNSLGFSIEVGGYNDKMAVLLEKVLVQIRDLQVKPDRFEIVKERLLRGYRNWDFQQPYHQVSELSRWLSNSLAWANEQCLAELLQITPEDITIFQPLLTRQVYTEILVHGNMYREDALRMTDLVESTLRPRPLPLSQTNAVRNFIIPEGSDFTFRKTLGDPANVNNGIEYYLYCGSLDDQKTRAKVLLLGQIGDEKGFDTLRTKEQLGYIVFTGPRVSNTTCGYRVIVQSERTPEYLETRINAFLASLGSYIKDMPKDEFEDHRRSLINKKLEKLKNLEQEGARFWSHISSGYFRFEQVDIDVEHLRNLTQEEMVEFFQHYISPTSPHRAKLSIQLAAQSSPSQVAGQLTVEEQKEKVISAISKALTVAGVQIDKEQFSKRFESVNVVEGDQDGILSAVHSYLVEDAGVPADQAEGIKSQGQELLGTILPSLGIEIKKDDGSLMPPPEGIKKTVFIEDAPRWKAELQLSSAPRPVKDLSEYEELEAKL
jgi:insulysin